MKRRVVITGIGLISPLGQSPEDVFSAVMEGRSAVRRWESETTKALAASASFDSSRWFSRLQLSGVDRVSQMAVAAADLACLDSNEAELGEQTGVYVGTGMGGATSIDLAFKNRFESGRTPPLTIPAFMSNAPAAHIAMRMKLHGPVLTYSIACASSAIAIIEAAKAIACGDIENALAGGSEALLVPSVVAAWQSLQTLANADTDSPSAGCRPFSADRTGLVLGEGAAFLLLEAYEVAIARGARIYAEIVGSGISCDAAHLTKPDATGQERALRSALKSSGLLPSDVGYCNAHGTATRAGDPIECESLSRVWGDDISQLWVSSTKSVHGHLLGAAGALEAAITAMALSHRQVPPSMHCAVPDAACAIRLVTEKNMPAPFLNAAISNSFAFGGTNAVLAFQRVH